MLTKMLQESPDFQKKQIPEKAIYMRLASTFQEDNRYLYMTPEELYYETQIGSRDLWKEFLGLQETMSYIKGLMAFLSNIAQRKSFSSLVKMSMEGNQQAAKQVQELSGIMNQQDQNRTIVLHKIPRPNEVTE